MALENMLLQGLFNRGGQFGPAAPVFQPGMSGFQPQGLLGDQSQEATRVIQQGPDFTAQSLEELIGRPEQRGQELAPQVTAQDEMGPPEESPMTLGQRAGGFFGNLDQTLQSPSKVIGMGLLNRIDPRLGAVGLLSGGLFGKNKVF